MSHSFRPLASPIVYNPTPGDLDRFLAPIDDVSPPTGLEYLLTRTRGLPGTLDPGQAPITARSAPRSARPVVPVGEAPDPGSIGGGDPTSEAGNAGTTVGPSPAAVAGFRGPTIGFGEHGFGFGAGPNSTGVGRGAALSFSPFSGTLSLTPTGLPSGVKSVVDAGLSLLGRPASLNLLSQIAPMLAGLAGPVGLGVTGFQGLVGLAGAVANALGIPTTHGILSTATEAQRAEALGGLGNAAAGLGPGEGMNLSDLQAAIAATNPGIGLTVYAGGPKGYAGYAPNQHALNYGGTARSEGFTTNAQGQRVSETLSESLGRQGRDLASLLGLGPRGTPDEDAPTTAPTPTPGVTAVPNAEDVAANAPTPAPTPGDTSGSTPGGPSDGPGSDTGGVGGVWHRGGTVAGRPRPGRQEVRGRLLEGEEVIDPDSAERFRPLLKTINAWRPGRHVPQGLERLLMRQVRR